MFDDGERETDQVTVLGALTVLSRLAKVAYMGLTRLKLVKTNY